MIGGEAWTLTYGARAGMIHEQGKNTVSFTAGDGSPPLVQETETRDDARFARLYANLRYEATDDVVLEAGVGGTWTDVGRGGHVTPRIGAAWSFYDGQWLRAFYRRDVVLPGYVTIEPVETVGLRGLESPANTGSRVDSAGAVWEAEWSDSVFTAVEYQHQWLQSASITNPGTIIDSYDIRDGELDRIAATMNLRLGGGFFRLRHRGVDAERRRRGRPHPVSA